MCWAAIHTDSVEEPLVDGIPIGSEGLLRTIMSKCLKDTRIDPKKRTFRQQFGILDNSYQREASEQAIRHMGEFKSFKKERWAGWRSFGLDSEK